MRLQRLVDAIDADASEEPLTTYSPRFLDIFGAVVLKLCTEVIISILYRLDFITSKWLGLQL